MTHEELLAKIDRYAHGTSMLDGKAWATLRAVVELHEPFGPLCYACNCNEHEHTVSWPCQTIRRIQRNLT